MIKIDGVDERDLAKTVQRFIYICKYLAYVHNVIPPRSLLSYHGINNGIVCDYKFRLDIYLLKFPVLGYNVFQRDGAWVVGNPDGTDAIVFNRGRATIYQVTEMVWVNARGMQMDMCIRNEYL